MRHERLNGADPFLRQPRADGTGDVVWEDLRVPISAIKVTGASPPTWTQLRNDGNNGTIYAIKATGITVPHAAELNLHSGGGFTISAWVKLASTGGAATKTICYKAGQFRAYVSNGNRPALALLGSVPFTLVSANTASTRINDTNWHHIVWVWETTVARIYLDGVQIAVGVGTATPSASVTDLFINADNATGTNGHAGYTDELILVQDILSPTGVLNLYGDGIGYYTTASFETLVAGWHFDEGTGVTAASIVGGHTGTINVPTWGPGKVGMGSRGVYAYAFAPGAVNECHFVAQFPHGWKEGSEVRPHVHYSKPTASANEPCWKLEYSKAKTGALLPFTSEVDNNGDSFLSQQAFHHEIMGLGAIDMTGDTISTMILCRLYRDGFCADDTYTTDVVYLLEVDLHYQRDADGSHLEYLK